MKPALSILGVPIHDVDFEETCAQVAAWLAAPGAHQIATVNPEFIMTARRNPAFAATLRRADLNVPDGVGVLWAARSLGCGRITQGSPHQIGALDLKIEPTQC